MPDDSDYYSANMDEGNGMDAASKKPTGDEDQMESETALLPKSMFGGKMPDVGEEYMFKVEHIYEDEVEISYAKDPAKGDEKKPTNGSTMDTATDAFDQMANPTGKE